MNNMEVWDKVKQPPPSALKTIQAGRLKGKSDINPQWRYQAMTEQFGTAGVGWGYNIVKLWKEECGDGQVMAFAEINLWTRVSDNLIPGIGGSMLITKEKEGLHVSDEGYKMAITDALSVAMKMLGIAADVYMGLWDGSKYSNATKVIKTGVAVNPVIKRDSPMVAEAKKEGATVKEHWCEEHQTEFFKKGKMNSYAHPIEGSDKWCYEHSSDKKDNEGINLGAIRTALTKKGYKTEDEQKSALLIKDWKEVTDLEGVMAFIDTIEIATIEESRA